MFKLMDKKIIAISRKKYFAMIFQVDHFGFVNSDTFKQRYLINTDNWHNGGPILFYTGNEGDIAWFCNNTVSKGRSFIHQVIFEK